VARPSTEQIVAVVASLAAAASTLGYGIPQSKRADANRDENYLTSDALKECKQERKEWRDRYLEEIHDAAGS